MVARELGLVEQTLRNWVKAAESGKHVGADAKAEQMELSRLRAENAQLKMHVEILKKRRRTLPRMRCEVRLDQRAAPPVSALTCAGSQPERLQSLEARRPARAHAADGLPLTAFKPWRAPSSHCHRRTSPPPHP